MRGTTFFAACASVAIGLALTLSQPVLAGFGSGPLAEMPATAADPLHTAQIESEVEDLDQAFGAVWDLLAWLDILEAIRQAEPLYEESFTRDRGDWDTESSTQIERSITDREYHLVVKEGPLSAVSTADIVASEFLAEVHVELVSAPAEGYAGIAFWYQDGDNYLAFLVNAEGEYALEQIADGHADMLADWQSSDAIEAREGAANTLAVLIHGPDIVLFANDIPLWEGVFAESGHAGDIGLLAGSNTDDDVIVAFDDLVVWDLTGMEVLPSLLDEPPSPEASSILLDPALLDSIYTEEPLLTESFTTQRREWLHSDENSQMFYDDRAYHIVVSQPDSVSWRGVDMSLSDFLAEVEVTHVEGPLDGDYGLVFRVADPQNFYRFIVAGDGAYELDKMVAGEWTDLISGSDPVALETGEGASNRIGVLAHGPTIALLINNQVLATVEDQGVLQGDIGMVAGTYDTPGLEVAFDDLEIWDLARFEFAGPEPETTATTDIESAGFDAAILETVRDTEPVMSESFTRERQPWRTVADEEFESFYADKAYHLRVSAQDELDWVLAQLPLADLYAEVDVTRVSGDSGGYASLLFRFQDEDNFYGVDIGADGSFALYKMSLGEWHAISSGDSLALDVAQGVTNRIGVLAQGPSLVVLANDVVIANAVDDTFAGGDFALAAGTYSAPENEIAYDDLLIWDLEPLAEQFGDIAAAVEPATEAQPVQTEEAPPDQSEVTPTPTTDVATTAVITEPVDTDAILANINEIRGREPTWSSDLAQDDGLLSVGEYETWSAGYREGAYHIAVQGDPDHFKAAPGDIFVEDFYAEVETEVLHDEFSEGVKYGIVFRDSLDGTQGYLFGIGTLGQYFLTKWIGPEQAESLIDWTDTDAMNTGSVDKNRLGLLVQGPRFVLLLNDIVLAEWQDDAYADGLISLGANKSFGGNDADVAFRNLRVWDLKPSPLRVTPQPVVATPTPELFPLDRVTISSPAFEACYTTISYPTIEARAIPIPGEGTMLTGDAIVADVVKISYEACRYFTAIFYDAAGLEIGEPSPVIFEPEPLFPGSQVKAYIFLPEGWERAVLLAIQ